MSLIFKTSILWLTVVLVCGCIQMRNANPDSVNSESEITVVLSAPNIKFIAMIAGVEADGEFKPFREGFAANISPDAGYVVTQLPARATGTRYAITQVILKEGGQVFNDCLWKQALTFPSHGGEVIYLGNFSFRENDSQLTVEQSNDFEKARAFMDSRYPNLRGLMKYTKPTLMRHAKADCVSRSRQYQIIFLPAKR